MTDGIRAWRGEEGDNKNEGSKARRITQARKQE
jgi:hypothetical protein